MATKTPRPGENGTVLGRSTGVTPNMSLSGTQQERRHQLLHRNAAHAATKNMTQDAHLKIIRKTGRSKKKKPRAIECDYICVRVNDGWLTV